MALEKTFVMLKPDALQRGLYGEIISRLEAKGLKFRAAKMFRFTPQLCREHYAHHAGKPFFPKLVEFMCSAPVLALVLEGKDAVNQVRAMCGATDCGKAAPGTIRGDLGLSVQSNLIHASDSRETAEAEIARFFTKEEVTGYPRQAEKSVHSEDELK
ncbi:MAG: nucleoside-diphosphate kinase [Candidatus ainarchaeum sp.]|nr:nucleoside-diphosphate kinase [Candidatus ainarchaeum sp.]